ncbi:MAG TPA: hypothetical protein VGA37_11880 [Gemmatimonadales bacterium]
MRFDLGRCLVFLGLFACPWKVGVAQVVRTAQIHVMATIADPSLVAGGLGIAVRPGGRFQLSATGSFGTRGKAAAFRGELLASFHLSPLGHRGLAPYAGGGAAILTQPGTAGVGRPETYLAVLVGVETTPASRVGWFAEVGIGGGARLVVGARWRAVRNRMP